MSITLEEQLRRAARVLDQHIEQRLAHGAYRPEQSVPNRHRMVAGIAAVAAASALLFGTMVLDRDRTETVVTAPAAPSHPAGSEGWSRLPETELAPRFQHLAVSTGTGLLVWGGYGVDGNRTDGNRTDGNRTDGAFFDGDTGAWRLLPDAPLAADRGDAVGAWTGTEVVVLNGVDGRVKAAAFDPASFGWRSLPDPPLSNAANMMTRAVFAEGAVVVIAVGAEGDGATRNEVARLDLATGRWQAGEGPPRSFGSGFDAVAAGDEVVVIGRRGVGGASCGESVVLTYRPTTGNWRELPSGPVSDLHGVAVVSTGSEVLASGGAACGEGSGRRDAFLLDPVNGTWRPVAPAPTGIDGSDRYGEVWTGRWAVATAADGAPVLYEPAADRWHLAPPNPLGSRHTEAPWSSVAGKIVVFGGGLSGDDGRCCDPVEGGYAYTPPSGG